MLEKIRYRLQVLLRLKPYAGGVKRFLLLNFLIGILLMLLGLVEPVFYRLFIDRVILKGEFALMGAVAAGYLSVFAMRFGLSHLKNYSVNRLVNRLTFRVKMKILRGFFRRDFSAYDGQSVGDMKMRLDDDTACIKAYMQTQTVDYVIAVITLLFSAVLLFLTEWRLALFACVVIPLSFWLDHVVAKREAVVQEQQRENDQRMSSWLHASVQGWREIKGLNLQKHEERQFVRYIHRYAILFGAWINYWVIRILVIPKIKEEFLMQFSLYFIGGLLIMEGDFGIGSLLVFMQYYSILSAALKTVSGADADLLTAMPQSGRMLEELSRGCPGQTGKQAMTESCRMEFRDVSFAYPGMAQNIVEGLSFTIHDGERVGLTGKSGAGKTTVLKLLAGMLQPSQGEVLFAGAALSRLPLRAVHQRIGFVMQENALFDASIRENLRYGKDHADEEEMMSACRKAFIDDFIRSLPQGLDTVIGERGVKLSGGQKQRIVLARLFLQEVRVFIFDEATSALDQYSESVIQDAIGSIGKDQTMIVVAHRESSLALCDRVIVL